MSGYRQSVQRATDLRRDTVLQRDSVVADDIASFPDTSLAESLQRITGMAITRDAGEGRQISLRGFGADFTRVRLNNEKTGPRAALLVSDSFADGRFGELFSAA